MYFYVKLKFLFHYNEKIHDSLNINNARQYVCTVYSQFIWRIAYPNEMNSKCYYQLGSFIYSLFFV